MTEELINKLSKIPGLRVPPPTSSFYFKDKQPTIADIARTLGVAYVLDGSVRKSGARLRVAARLIRADNGFVVWSETYDRPFDDILMVQDDQAVRLPQELKFPENVKEVRIRKQGDGLLLSPVRADWSSFFALQVDVPDDFLVDRHDLPPQSRDPL